MAKQYWLMKSEPGDYSIDDLEKDGSTYWDGVRNYQARNLMRRMQVGDGVFFYHSVAKPPGIAGIARVCKPAYVDHTQFDPADKHFDPKASPEKPRWEMVDIEFVAKLDEILPLPELREVPQLEGMALLRKGQRLSVQPVEKAHWNAVCSASASGRASSEPAGARQRIVLPSSEATRSQASLAVRFSRSRIGLISTTSAEPTRPDSPTISISRWASR